MSDDVDDGVEQSDLERVEEWTEAAMTDAEILAACDGVRGRIKRIGKDTNATWATEVIEKLEAAARRSVELEARVRELEEERRLDREAIERLANAFEGLWSETTDGEFGKPNEAAYRAARARLAKKETT